jgi:hypothetical protein
MGRVLSPFYSSSSSLISLSSSSSSSPLLSLSSLSFLSCSHLRVATLVSFRNSRMRSTLSFVCSRTLRLALHSRPGGRDSAPVRGVPYEPTALYRVCRAKFESVEVLWRVVCDRGGVVMEC